MKKKIVNEQDNPDTFEQMNNTYRQIVQKYDNYIEITRTEYFQIANISERFQGYPPLRHGQWFYCSSKRQNSCYRDSMSRSVAIVSYKIDDDNVYSALFVGRKDTK